MGQLLKGSTRKSNHYRNIFLPSIVLLVLFLTIKSNYFFKIQIKIGHESQNTGYAWRRGKNMQPSTIWAQIIITAPGVKLQSLNCIAGKKKITAQPQTTTDTFF